MGIEALQLFNFLVPSSSALQLSGSKLLSSLVFQLFSSNKVLSK